MDSVKSLIDAWPLILTFGGLIAWGVRLETKTGSQREHSKSWANQLKKDLDRIEKRQDEMELKHNALDQKVVEQLTEVRESLARIEGALGIGRGIPIV